jgi:hypothetical protein
MNEFKGKICNILIQINNSNLFYKAEVLDITHSHMTFKDKFNKIYTFSLDSIKSISES